MSTRRLSALVSTALAGTAIFAFAASGQEVKVVAGGIEDQRSSLERMGGLSVEVLLEGDLAADVKALRVKLKSAKDDTGTSLYKPAKDAEPQGFEDFGVNTSPKPKIHLAPPARGASKVEILGDVELFVPKKDPNTNLRIEKFRAALDKPISNAALKSAKVEITPLTAKEYMARQQKNKPTKEQIEAEGKKRGATDEEIKQMVALMEAFSKLGGEEPGENSLLFESKDPEARIMAMQIVDKAGQEIHAGGRSSSGGNERKLTKIDLSEKLPADAALLVTLRTPKSIVTVPLNMKEVTLP